MSFLDEIILPTGQKVSEIALVTAASWASGGLDRNGVKARGAKITNEIEASMDLNRAAFESGTIPIDLFDENWKFLWTAYRNAAEEIAVSQPDYARGMIGDRSWGGQFGQWWQGTLHEDAISFARGKLDSSGFILPQFQEPWPPKAKFYDTDPYAQQPGNLPKMKGGDLQQPEQPPRTEPRPAPSKTSLVPAGLALVAGLALLKGGG